MSADINDTDLPHPPRETVDNSARDSYASSFSSGWTTTWN